MKYLFALFIYISMGCIVHLIVLGSTFSAISSIAVIGAWPFIVAAFMVVVALVITLAVFTIALIGELLNYR